MPVLVAIFWISAAIVAYTYVIYPLLMGFLAWIRPKAIRRTEGFRPHTTVLLAAFNEEATIGRRVSEFVRLLEHSKVTGEVMVVSDGSTDRTVSIVEAMVGGRRDSAVSVCLVELPVNRGKALALTEGGKQARGEIIVLADARQTWAEDAITKILENFADPDVGAVTGELMIESAPGVLAGIGLYWKFEKWLRLRESRVHSMVGVTGAVCAVRRDLFRPIPEGTITDDLYWPLLVAMQGRRVVFDPRAVAYDRLPDKVHDEFRRKVRTLCGNFQLIARLPGTVLPWRNPIWFAFISHKPLRLVVPWALIAMFFSSLAIGGAFYATLFTIQLIGYSIAVSGLYDPIGKKMRLAGTGASFLVLNAAAWMSFWVWISGNSSKSWRKVKYHTHAATATVGPPGP